MTNLIPMNTMYNFLSNWPNIWEDEDTRVYGASFNNDIDLYETDDAVIVRANVAGIKNEDIDVTFERGILWIRANSERKDEKANKYYSKAAWDYSYKVRIPNIVDYQTEPSVKLENGLLIIEFKKSEASKPKRLKIQAH